MLLSFLEPQSSLKWTPSESRSQSNKVWFVRISCWMDLCITNRKRHQTAKADFIFSLQSQPNFRSLILSFSLQLGQLAVLLTVKRKRKSLSIVVQSPRFHNPTPSFSHGHTYSHIYTVKTQLQAANGPNHRSVLK